MEDEFSTDMHYDMLKDEFSEFKFTVKAVYGAIRGGDT